MNEIFKDIADFEGLYQVSNLGRVKSLPKGDGNGNRERILKLEVIQKSNTSYNRVTLSKNGKTYRYFVHRLVAQTFIPNPDKKPMVNHIDNKGLNNCVANLEWCSHAENMEHSIKQGRQDTVRSLGGIASGKIRAQKAKEFAESLVGKVFGSLTVTATYKDMSTVRKNYKYICACACGNTTEKNYAKLTSGVQACPECTYKARSVTRRLKTQGNDIVSAT